MKKTITFTGLLLLAHSAEAHAANLALITTPMNLINVAVLLIAIAGVVGSIQVLSLVRGGALSKSWQLFVVGFIALALGQCIYVLNAVEVFAAPSFIAPALLAAAIGVIIYGVWQAKGVLE
jgi:hypothetical protein